MKNDGEVFEGKTLDDAVRKGLDALGLSRAEVMITMVEEGSGGFLGIGSRPYRVRIMPRPGGAIREHDEKPGDGRRQGRAQRQRSGRGDRGASTRGRGKGPRGRDGGRRERGDSVTASRDESSRSGPRRSGDRRRERGKGRGRERRGRVEERIVRSGGNRERENGARAGDSPVRPGIQDAPGLSGEELVAQGKRLTEDLLRHMGFEANVTASNDENRVNVAVQLEAQEDLLTGRKGEVRQALQHLLNLMLNRGGQTRYHLQLEINDFWQRREEELRELARSMADRAVTDDSEAVTEYLNAQERRIVHMALRDDERVKTYALGTGLIKRVAIAPADFPEDPETEGP